MKSKSVTGFPVTSGDFCAVSHTLAPFFPVNSYGAKATHFKLVRAASKAYTRFPERPGDPAHERAHPDKEQYR